MNNENLTEMNVEARKKELLGLAQKMQNERQQLLVMIMEREENLEARERALIEKERKLLEREKKLNVVIKKLRARVKKNIH